MELTPRPANATTHTLVIHLDAAAQPIGGGFTTWRNSTPMAISTCEPAPFETLEEYVAQLLERIEVQLALW